jgi:hypothetical protein
MRIHAFNECNLRPESLDSSIGQSDIRDSERRAIDTSGNQVAANQPGILHEEQVFEHLAFFEEMF